MGTIDKIPGGRPRKSAAAKQHPKVIKQARAVVARGMAELPMLPSGPWPDQSNTEKLDTLTGQSLDKVKEILDLPCEAANLKLLSIQKDAALSILSVRARTDETQLRAKVGADKIAELLEALRKEDQPT